MKVMENQLLVIFGASGDLTSRKLIPALFELYNQQLLPDHFAILGVSRTEYTDLQFRSKIADDLMKVIEKKENNAEHIDAFCKLAFYIAIETAESSDYYKVKDRIAELESVFHTDGNCIFYLATPPGLYEVIASGLKENGLT